ncbi:hypothetical protein HPP92_029007 [Vanilla planifolia]|uniref:Uncharacterized protein n=1 Tax=Vanilla planifolia TaxID=51239 RepID=A0A835P597_VANPL|nr:hypothetical protein HPP92_029007 [Vanilla planifolia]KAG0446113.1 hypothetical protein HPP92_028995 [Vanilla planifolia]
MKEEREQMRHTNPKLTNEETMPFRQWRYAVWCNRLNQSTHNAHFKEPSMSMQVPDRLNVASLPQCNKAGDKSSLRQMEGGGFQPLHHTTQHVVGVVLMKKVLWSDTQRDF